MNWIYLAGPFFNPAQVEKMERIETAFRNRGVPFFSPRLEGVTLTRHASPAIREEVLQSNLRGIRSAGALLACLDYDLPEGQQLRVMNGLGQAVSPQLHLPDSGTVWELGMAFERQVPIVLLKTTPGPLNVMLAETAEAVLKSFEELEKFAFAYQYAGRFPRGEFAGWEGEVR